MKKLKEKNKDSYLWLEKASKKKNSWIKAREKETADYFSKNKIRSRLKNRLKDFFQVTSMDTPVIRGEFYFFSYRKPKEENHSIYIQKRNKKVPVLLIDVNKLRKKMGVLMSWHVSKDSKWIAVEFSKSGNDKIEIRIFDVENKKFLKEYITSDNHPYFGSWDSNSGFWYMRGAKNRKLGEEKYFKHVYFHKLGESVTEDKVFFKKGLRKEDWPSIKLSHDNKYVLIWVLGRDQNSRIFFKDLTNLKSKFIEVNEGMLAESFAMIANGYIYMETNHRAPNSKILRRKILKDKLSNWTVFIPERENRINNWSLVSDYLILEYLVNVSSNFFAVRIRDKKIKEIKLPGIGSIGEISTDFGKKEFFFSFSSFNIPSRIYKVNLKDFKPEIFWKLDIPVDIGNLTIKQKWYKSKDETKVPMFVVSKKGIKLNKKNPTLVYAYGGFGVSITPGFWSSIIPFLESGGIFVVVNIRGGGELGEKWHKSAILKNKEKGFEDFSFSLKYLVEKNYTNPSKIAIWGESNGGLLVSVMLTRYPRQFRVAVVGSAVTDMLRYHLFDGGRFWIGEYGDPDDKKMRAYLLKYSPYHNIRSLSYPSVMFITSDQDDRVSPVHSYKMVARLKDVGISKNPVLLRVEKSAGHSGANKTSSSIEESADMLAFIYKELEINNE